MITSRCDTINLSVTQIQYFNENLIFSFTPYLYNFDPISFHNYEYSHIHPKHENIILLKNFG